MAWQTLFTPPRLVLWVYFVLGVGALHAEPLYPDIQSLVIFGDGYSDTGRLSGSVSTSEPGLVWVDYLATALGLPEPVPYSAATRPNGRDFAVGGATAGDPPIPVFPSGESQIGEYLGELGGTPPSADVLVIVWLGTTDVLNAENDPTAAADALHGHLERLVLAGGRQFLVPELIPMGMMPENLSKAAEFDARALAFNARLETHLASLRQSHPDLWFKKVRVHTLFEAIRSQPASFGFENITLPTFLPGTTLDPNTHLWWDNTHPTSAAHAHIADFAALEIAAALGKVSVSQLSLVLTPDLVEWALSVRGPELSTVTVEMSNDGANWTPIATFTPFSGLENLVLENDEIGSPRFYRAR